MSWKKKKILECSLAVDRRSRPISWKTVLGINLLYFLKKGEKDSRKEQPCTKKIQQEQSDLYVCLYDSNNQYYPAFLPLQLFISNLHLIERKYARLREKQ